MAVKVGAIIVVVATVSVMFGGVGFNDPFAETRHQILAVIAGLTGYAVVILGVIDSPPKQRRIAAFVAGALLLPTSILCLLGARLISLGWFRTTNIYWLGVLGVVLAFVVPALVAAGVLWSIVAWIQRRRPPERKYHAVIIPPLLSRGFAMRLIAGAILINAGVTLLGPTLSRYGWQEDFARFGFFMLVSIGLVLMVSGRRAKRD